MPSFYQDISVTTVMDTLKKYYPVQFSKSDSVNIYFSQHEAISTSGKHKYIYFRPIIILWRYGSKPEAVDNNGEWFFRQFGNSFMAFKIENSNHSLVEGNDIVVINVPTVKHVANAKYRYSYYAYDILGCERTQPKTVARVRKIMEEQNQKYGTVADVYRKRRDEYAVRKYELNHEPVYGMLVAVTLDE